MQDVVFETNFSSVFVEITYFSLKWVIDSQGIWSSAVPGMLLSKPTNMGLAAKTKGEISGKIPFLVD